MLRAAPWNTTSLPSTRRSTTAGSHTEPCTNSNPDSGRFSRRPVKRSSSTVTRAFSRSSRRTSALPTNPAPPVTSTLRFSRDIAGPLELGSALEPETEIDERSHDAPSVADEPHLGRAARMIAHRDRHFMDAVPAAHRLEEQVGLELVAVEPRLVETDPRVVEQVRAERPEPVRAVGRRIAAGDAEERGIDAGEPAPLRGDAGHRPARQPARALHQVRGACEQRLEQSRQLVGLVLVVAREDHRDREALALGGE